MKIKDIYTKHQKVVVLEHRLKTYIYTEHYDEWGGFVMFRFEYENGEECWGHPDLLQMARDLIEERDAVNKA
jgi:hypothetical protein